MTNEEFKRLKAEIDEVAALRDNLKATQNRCTDLLTENRRLNRELDACGHAMTALNRTVGQLEQELALLRPKPKTAPKRKVFQPDPNREPLTEEKVKELLEEGLKVREALKPSLDRLSAPYDPEDENALIDGGGAGWRRHQAEQHEDESLTLVAYAQKKGKKATEVLMKLLGWGREGVHVNTKLDPETIKQLDEEYDPPVVDVATPTSESLPRNAIESPHKQPPFQPRKAPWDRGVVFDGVSRSHGIGRGRID